MSSTLQSLPSSTMLGAAPTGSTATQTPASQPSSAPQSSPLLFFVALGFGVVFTNLWIIVGVKYCFRYNARHRPRQDANGDPIDLGNMPRQHRRRREKKLMTMDEVNERFPITKYKTWVSSRAEKGLPTAGGVDADATAGNALATGDKDAQIATDTAPAETPHIADTASSSNVPEITTSTVPDQDPAATSSSGNLPPQTSASEVDHSKATESTDADHAVSEKKQDALPSIEPVATNAITLENTSSSNPALHATPSATSAPIPSDTPTSPPPNDEQDDHDDDDDDPIQVAVPQEMLDNPGDACAICIDTLEADDDVRGLTCGHAFHASCVDPWLTSRRACCPLCKADYYVPKPRPEGEAAATSNAQSSRSHRGDIRVRGANGARLSPTAVILLGGRPERRHHHRDHRRHRDRDRNRSRRTEASQQPPTPSEVVNPAPANVESGNSSGGAFFFAAPFRSITGWRRHPQPVEPSASLPTAEPMTSPSTAAVPSIVTPGVADESSEGAPVLPEIAVSRHSRWAHRLSAPSWMHRGPQTSSTELNAVEAPEASTDAVTPSQLEAGAVRT